MPFLLQWMHFDQRNAFVVGLCLSSETFKGVTFYSRTFRLKEKKTYHKGRFFSLNGAMPVCIKTNLMAFFTPTTTCTLGILLMTT